MEPYTDSNRNIRSDGTDRIQILTTLNENYLPRLQVLLTSLHISQRAEPADIWLIHSDIPEDAFAPVIRQCNRIGYHLYPVRIDSSTFTGAPVSRQYPCEMYYRLLAPMFLPETLHRILYLDPDILNAMYGFRTLEIEDAVWNYDARNYNTCLLKSGGLCDMDWVMENTAILHFCGKSKPWQKGYIHRFGILYKHYEHLTKIGSRH